MVELEECCSATGDSSVSPASTVQGNQKFSLLKWFKRSSKSLPYNQTEKLTNEGNNNYFSSCDSISTFYSTTTVRSFDFHTGIDTLNNYGEEKNYIDLSNQNSKKIGPFGVGAVKIISKNGVNNNTNNNNNINGNLLSVTQTLPANALSRGRDITARYSLQNCTVSFGSCDNLSVSNNSTKRESAKLHATRACGSNVKRVHVRGKRKAPSPPTIAIRPKSICEELHTITTSSSSTRRKKKKRPAPKLPNDVCFNKKLLAKNSDVKDPENNQEIKINNNSKDQIVEGNNFGNEKIDAELEDLKEDRDENLEETNRDSSDEFECENSWEDNSSVRRISNDTLILQGGKLHSKNDPGLTATLPVHKKYNKSSTAMPRPWYKRSVFEQKDDSQIPTTSKTSSANESGSLRNFFNKSFDKNNSDDKKKDTKRKSGLSILMNISELDKEAAAIVQEEQARSRAAMLLQSSRFDNIEKRGNDNEGVVQEIVTSAMENSPRKGTRALISKFNAISNIAKVNVNTNFFGRKDSNRSEQRESEWKRKQETPEVSRINKDLSRYFPRRPMEEFSPQEKIIINQETKIHSESIKSSPKFNQKFITARSQFLNEFKLKNTPSPPSISRRLSSNKDEKLQHQDAPGCSGGGGGDKTFINVNSPKLLHVKVMEHRNITSEKLNIENSSSCDTIQREFSNIFEEIDKQLTPPRNTMTDKKLKYFNSPSNKVGKVLDILVQAEQNERKNDKVKSAFLNNNNNNNKDNVKDLKEMLKEMKNSLPKRPKQKKIDESRDKISSEMESKKLTNHVKITGPPIVHIGPRKFNYSSMDSKKVSSSVQTSGNIRKIDKSNVKNLTNDFIRSVKNDSSSASSSSSSPSSSTIGKKFHLMRPREFAAIEAIITTENNHDDDNTYENVIEKSIYANSIVLPSRHHRIIPIPENPRSAWGKEKFPEPVEVQVSKSSFTNTVDENPVTMEQKMNTLAVNRLLKRLEAAIASGNHQQAAGLAKDLAKLKIQCSVVRQKTKENNIFNVDMYIEDRLAHQGPIPLQLELTMTIAQLKNKIFHEFQIPKNVQRWIIGRRLADNDDSTLEELEIIEGLPVFLYLIAPVFQIGEDKNIKNLTISTNNITKKITTLNKIKINDSSMMKIDEKINDNKERNEENKIEENKQNKIEENKENKIEEKMENKANNDVEKNLKNTDRQEQINVKVEIQRKVDNINDKVVADENNATDNENEKDKKNVEKEKKKENAVGLVENIQMEQYNELIMLENCGLVPNTNSIECPICFMIYSPGEGVILRDCLHTFCRTCIESTIRYCGEAEVKCPYMDSEYTCESTLQEREIKALVDSQVYEKHLAKSVSQAENNAGHHAFHCKTPDCPGWCIYDDNVNNFLCPVCDSTNCLTCRVIHNGKNCWEYQEDVRLSKETDEESKRTATMLTEMLERGEAMTCPTCDVVLMKKWGCDWLRCSMCKTEICWVTRGPRWGPLGKGDTSGGCKCGENGVKCHPRCNYCH